MDIEKLHKLNELKEKGIINEEEWLDSQRKILSKKQEHVAPIIMIAVAGLFFIFVMMNSYQRAGLKSYQCDNSELLGGKLLELVNDMPLVELSRKTAIYIDNPIEISYNPEKEERFCKAVVKFSNLLTLPLEYKLFIKNDNVMVEAWLDPQNS